MLVSILTPSLNQRAWLLDNLASVVAQTYPAVEQIVVDGGSDDGSVELLASARSHTLRWVSEPDRGQSHALNKALTMSAGDIIGWVNADDGYADRRAVERAVACFVRHPEIDVVFGHSLLIGPANQVLQVLWAPPYLSRLTRYVTPFYQPSVFFRRPALEAGFVDESLHYVMDFDLWRRLWDSYRFRRIPLFIGLERHQPNRKVYSAAYRQERAGYFARHLPERDRMVDRLVRASYVGTERLAGIAVSERVRRTIDPTIALSWPPARRLVQTQLALNRADLGFD
jgi:glycosyltransferase involved in cell wall biosynthesis